MIDWSGYELISGAASTRSSGRPPVRMAPARRGVQGPLARAAAAHDDARPPDDGADADPHRLRGVRGRRAVDSRLSSSCSSASASSSRSSAGRRDRHQSAARVGRAAHRARRARRPPRRGGPGVALPRLAIRAYPRRYESRWTAPMARSCASGRSGPRTTARRGLPPRALAGDRLSPLPHQPRFDERTAHERLIRICFLDYDRELALVAEHDRAGDGRRSSGSRA